MLITSFHIGTFAHCHIRTLSHCHIATLMLTPSAGLSAILGSRAFSVGQGLLLRHGAAFRASCSTRSRTSAIVRRCPAVRRCIAPRFPFRRSRARGVASVRQGFALLSVFRAGCGLWEYSVFRGLRGGAEVFFPLRAAEVSCR